MRLLLDTHVLLWWLDDVSQIAEGCRAMIASPDSDVLVSTASLWEIVLKVRIGKLAGNLEKIEQALITNDFERLGMERAHLEALAKLSFVHKDPFDHTLVAQAIAEDLTLISDDRILRRYPVRVVSTRDPS